MLQTILKRTLNMRLESKQEMGLDGAISLMSSNSLLGQKVYFRNKRYVVLKNLNINWEYEKLMMLSFQKLPSSSPLSLRRLRLRLNLATFIISQLPEPNPATRPGCYWPGFFWWFFASRNGFNQNCRCKKRWSSCW